MYASQYTWKMANTSATIYQPNAAAKWLLLQTYTNDSPTLLVTMKEQVLEEWHVLTFTKPAILAVY